MDYVAGQRFRTTAEIETICLTEYRAPFTGGCEVYLPVGFEFEVMHDPVPGSTGVNCRALDYEYWEEALVPPHERADDKYSGYHLMMSFDVIAVNCEIISDAT